ncbi:MAG: trehalase family glycosidase [Terriglobia bacterium]|jgi:glycogen debranching enzyme
MPINAGANESRARPAKAQRSLSGCYADRLPVVGNDLVGPGRWINTDAVDLNALWSMDAYYLSLIAAELDEQGDASRFRQEHVDTNDRINQILWNEELGLYCHRFWNGHTRHWVTDDHRQERGRWECPRGMDKWRAKNASHSCTPPAAVAE